VREGELRRFGKLVRLEPTELGQVVARTGLTGGASGPRQAEDDSAAVGLEPEAEEFERLDLERRLLANLAPQPVHRMLVLVQEAPGKVPAPRSWLDGPPPEQYAAPPVETHGLRAGNGVRVPDVAASRALGAVLNLLDSLAANGTEAPVVQGTHAKDHMSPRAAGATQHELSRIGLLATLSGQTLARLAQGMTREEIPAGAGVVAEGDEGDRFYVVLNGMLSVSQQSRGAQAVLRPGDYFGEVALAMHMPRTASVRALTPVTVASCDRETFDEFVRPLFADDS